MLADRIAALDTRLFAQIESQSTDSDRKSLLAVHAAVAGRTSFSYLEIGSYLGGSLQVVIADPRCVRAVSIDPRPQSPLDDRPAVARWEYPDNSTERMVKLLGDVPGADLSKLESVEESTEKLAPGRFARPDLCFIDGEHTYGAALRDARFCRTVMQGAGIIAFHDFWIIERAVADFLRETPRPHRAYLLSDTVFIVELGATPSLLNDPRVRAQLGRYWRLWVAANRAGLDSWIVAAYIRRDQRRRPARASRKGSR